MAGKTKNTKTKKRNYKKRKYANTKISKSPFPQQKLAKFKYVTSSDHFSDDSVGTAFNHVYVANGMYLPDWTDQATNKHQPYCFAQWMAAYNHYYVYKSVMTVHMQVAENTFKTLCVTLGIRNDNSATEIANGNQALAIERANTKFVTFSSNDGQKTLSHTFVSKKEHPNKTEDLLGSSAANPVEKSFFVLGVSNTMDDTVISIPSIVEIDYYAILSEPKVFGSSTAP